MARIAFLLLAHKDPTAVSDLVTHLSAAGHYVVIHYDRSSPAGEYDAIATAFKDASNVRLVPDRVRCGWGDWSLVEATLRTMALAEREFADATHFYLLSGDCLPIKPANFLERYLDERDVDFIETHDFHESSWIKTGFRDERLRYFHLFNERSETKLFYASFHLQKRLGIRRKPPADLRVMIGSQWWCLRRKTVEALIVLIRQRKDVTRFFRHTWIPDEIFFQSLVAHLVPWRERENRTLTFLLFSDYGQPVNFFNDHGDYLRRQDAMFARKVSGHAKALRQSLLRGFIGLDHTPAVSRDGTRLFTFLTGLGRGGVRFGLRRWEKDCQPLAGPDLIVIVCKKWHVGKRAAKELESHGYGTAIDYAFNEDAAPLPDLGGVNRTSAKRNRNRRAFLQLLVAKLGHSRLIICVDPASLDVLDDLREMSAPIKYLELKCDQSDDFLVGHALRSGLLDASTPEPEIWRLMNAVRSELQREEREFAKFCGAARYVWRQGASSLQNADAVARFLDITREEALSIVASPELFSD